MWLSLPYLRLTISTIQVNKRVKVIVTTQAETNKMVATKSEKKLATSATTKKKKDSSKHKLTSKKGDVEKSAVAAAVVKAEAKADSKASSPPPLPFQANDKHKMALVKLLYCHRDKTSMTYEELSREIGTGEKTKSWQCGAWRDLKVHEYVVVASSSSSKGTCYELSEKGVKLAKFFASDEDLASMKMPETNEELHASIRSRLEGQKKTKKYGPLIFDFLLKAEAPLHRKEIATALKTNPDSHGFFYALQQLKKMGMVCTATGMPKNKAKGGGQLLKLSEKAFLVSVPNASNTTNTTRGEDKVASSCGGDSIMMKAENSKNAAVSDDE